MPIDQIQSGSWVVCVVSEHLLKSFVQLIEVCGEFLKGLVHHDILEPIIQFVKSLASPILEPL